MSELVTCESCGTAYDADDGCPHDHWYCAACLVECLTCVDDIRDSLDAEEYVP